MMVRIRYPDGRYDLVKAAMLDLLINLRQINQFERSDGWAIIGRDPLRGVGGGYGGPERRTVANNMV
jgi:hypothetical protein